VDPWIVTGSKCSNLQPYIQHKQHLKNISIIVKLQHDAYHNHLFHCLKLKGTQYPQLLDFISHVKVQCRKGIVSFTVGGVSFRLLTRHGFFFAHGQHLFFCLITNADCQLLLTSPKKTRTRIHRHNNETSTKNYKLHHP
jgi:hypothetical protein